MILHMFYEVQGLHHCCSSQRNYEARITSYQTEEELFNYLTTEGYCSEDKDCKYICLYITLTQEFVRVNFQSVCQHLREYPLTCANYSNCDVCVGYIFFSSTGFNKDTYDEILDFYKKMPRIDNMIGEFPKFRPPECSYCQIPIRTDSLWMNTCEICDTNLCLQ
jgi:hypothetical protein